MPLCLAHLAASWVSEIVYVQFLALTFSTGNEGIDNNLCAIEEVSKLWDRDLSGSIIQ